MTKLQLKQFRNGDRVRYIGEQGELFPHKTASNALAKSLLSCYYSLLLALTRGFSDQQQPRAECTNAVCPTT